MKNKYLSEGKQTKITPSLTAIENSIKGDEFNFIANTLMWMRSNLKKMPKNINKNDIFRKRTATEIVENGYTSGCTDDALIFVALCRAHNIPTKYVEAIKTKWLEDDNSKTIKGHIFAECFINGEWYQIDPQRGVIQTKLNYKGFEIFEEGLDSWDIGITDFDSLKNKFEKFKQNYN